MTALRAALLAVMAILAAPIVAAAAAGAMAPVDAFLSLRFAAVPQAEFEDWMRREPGLVPGLAAHVLQGDERTAEYLLCNPCVVPANRPDPGGSVLRYRFAAWWMSMRGARLEVDGACGSACTILADVLATRGLACRGPHAELWFHAAKDADGTLSDIAYSPPIEAALAPLDEGFQILKGDALAEILPTC
ncbi:hypothetical protein [Salinarimonas rosea]|uniref:hypothetical protein n=1 Tax=Salinarimonas rosea TaxID=552063 RepID=UPI0003FAB2B2|nr:hypothetical protein [Salinarimonas rosea]